jgi:hypothetical protein
MGWLMLAAHSESGVLACRTASLLFLSILGCARPAVRPPTPVPTAEQRRAEEAEKLRALNREALKKNLAEAERYNNAVENIHSMRVGDSYETFRRKVNAAGLLLAHTYTTPNSRIEEYWFYTYEGRKTFTAYIRDGRLVNYVAEGLEN